jgi:hypothetical protein
MRSSAAYSHEDLRHLGKRDETTNLRGQSFLRPYDEIAGYSETLDQAAQDLPLQWSFEIGERDIAAKDEIEGAVWRFRA